MTFAAIINLIALATSAIQAAVSNTTVKTAAQIVGYIAQITGAVESAVAGKITEALCREQITQIVVELGAADLKADAARAAQDAAADAALKAKFPGGQ